jgi:hypothetical protein
MKAIHETGFKGYVAQEFIPKNLNKLESLKRQLQFVIFNDYKNRTHDKRRTFNKYWFGPGAIALAPSFAFESEKGQWEFNYGH